MGKKEREFEGGEECVWLTRARLASRHCGKTELGMDTIYDNNTRMLLGVVGWMGASMAAGKCAPAK